MVQCSYCTLAQAVMVPVSPRVCGSEPPTRQQQFKQPLLNIMVSTAYPLVYNSYIVSPHGGPFSPCPFDSGGAFDPLCCSRGLLQSGPVMVGGRQMIDEMVWSCVDEGSQSSRSFLIPETESEPCLFGGIASSLQGAALLNQLAIKVLSVEFTVVS